MSQVTSEIVLSPTPVGAAESTGGFSGALRRIAYRIPEHRARHWLLLLLADRVNLVEERLIESARRRPALALTGLVAGALVGGALVARRWR
jgi:hypothetical protein